MVLKIPAFARNGVTGEVTWGVRYGMTVEKEAKDGTKECIVRAGATTYTFDCLRPTATTLRMLRQFTGYSTVEEELERARGLEGLHKALAESGQSGQQWVFGNLLAARVEPPHWQKFRRLAVQSGVRGVGTPGVDASAARR